MACAAAYDPSVIPAKAGIQGSEGLNRWTPASAGVTVNVNRYSILRML